MDRVNALNYTTIGGKRFFVDEGLGLAGTELAADWHNGVQESIVLPVEAVGMTLNDSDNTQLFQAISRLSGAGVDTITATTALTPANCGMVFVSAAAGNITITLPAAAALSGTLNGTSQLNSAGVCFVRTDTTANTVTIIAAGADVLMLAPATSYSLVPSEIASFASNGSAGWYLRSTNRTSNTLSFLTPGVFLYVPSPGMIECNVQVLGAGGAGGGTGAQGSTTVMLAGGGGSGFFAEATFSRAQIGASQYVTVGAAGVGVVGGAGGNGGASSLGALLSAGGGLGAPIGNSIGTSSIGFATPGGGSLTGAGYTTDFTIGAQGQYGLATLGLASSGQGANSRLGGGGGAVGANTTGNAGGHGAGGSGSCTGSSGAAYGGGNGGGGLVKITELF